MPSKTTWSVFSLAAVATAVIASGCSPGHPSPPTTPSPSSPIVATDKDGFTLYRFDESTLPITQRRTDPHVDPLPDRRLLTCDAGTPPDWSLVEYQQNPTLPGVDRTLLGYLQRADGRRQLTLNGCPIYRHRGDRKPGQTTGHHAAAAWIPLIPANIASPHGGDFLRRTRDIRSDVAATVGRDREAIALFGEVTTSVTSAASVSTATAAVLLGLAPTPAQARPALPDDTGTVATASTAVPPPGGVIDCTAGPAFRFARPCLIRSLPVRSPLIG
jgi:predicted lipoprotein with Yx(FWY)xxD motif